MSLMHTFAHIAADYGLTAVAGRALPGRSVILCFHRFTRDAGATLDPSQYVSVGHVTRIVERLRSLGFCFVPLGDLAGQRSGRAERRAAVTVDDGFRDFASVGVPLFARLGVPSTLFVCSGFAGRSALSLWAVAEHLVGSVSCITWEEGGRSAVLPAATTEEKRQSFGRIRSSIESSLEGRHALLQACEIHGIDTRDVMGANFLSADEIRDLAGRDGVDIGAHSVTHPQLARLETPVALAELRESKLYLESLLRRPVRTFAYPFGRVCDCGAREAELARACGYDLAVTTRPGVIGRRPDWHLLPRLDLNGRDESRQYIDFSVSGLKAIAARCSQAVRGITASGT